MGTGSSHINKCDTKKYQAVLNQPLSIIWEHIIKHWINHANGKNTLSRNKMYECQTSTQINSAQSPTDTAELWILFYNLRICILNFKSDWNQGGKTISELI